MISVSAQWDQTGFDSAMKEAARFTRRTPALAINIAAFHVTLFWISEMDKVPVERIDAELAATLSPGRLKSGKLSKAKRRQREIVSVAVGGAGRSTTVPLAVLIIQARARPGSNYNRITGNRWAAPSPYKGLSRAAGASAMAAAVSRMIKARHRSVAFLASSMLPAADDLRPFAGRGGRGGAPPVDAKNVREYGSEKGGAIPAVEGAAVAVCTIYSNIGLFGVQAQGQYEAIWNHGGPAMQRAIDKEAEMQVLYVWQHELAEFNKMASRF